MLEEEHWRAVVRDWLGDELVDPTLLGVRGTTKSLRTNDLVWGGVCERLQNPQQINQSKRGFHRH